MHRVTMYPSGGAPEGKMPKVKGLPATQFTGTRPKLPDLFTRYSEQVQAEFCSILPNGSMELSDPFRYHLGWADESGERLLGGILVGDAEQYGDLLLANREGLPVPEKIEEMKELTKPFWERSGVGVC